MMETSRYWEGELKRKCPRFVVMWHDSSVETIPNYVEHNLDDIRVDQVFGAYVNLDPAGRVEKIWVIREMEGWT
jgi:hypothetical protein